MKKKNTKQFIKESIGKYGNRYGYEKVVYANNYTKVTITCHIHDDFDQTPNNHLSGQGCPKCAGVAKKYTEQFSKEAIEQHGNIYGYEKAFYVNNHTKVTITCHIHGYFEQTPSAHLSGHGCQKCGGSEKKDIEQFICKGNIIHKSFYNYSKINYIGAGKKVIIICPDHGDFNQRPGHHLSGQGCPKCAGVAKKDTGQFIKEAIEKHENKWSYEKVNYINALTKVIITCPDHGDFEQTPNKHLRGRGCPKCAGVVKKDAEQFIKEAIEKHENKWSYEKVNYINALTKVIITCPDHGDFEQTPNKHLRGRGCPKCAHIISKPETIWLDSLNIDPKYRQAKIKIGKKYIKADAYVSETNTVYEFHGKFWHGSPKYFNPNDINPKTKITYGELYKKTLDRESLIKNAGYKLIVKWED